MTDGETAYRRLVEVLPDAVFVHVEGQIRYANPAFLRLRGVTDLGDVVGLTPFDLFPADEHAQIRERIGRISRTGQAEPSLVRTLLDARGARRPVSVIASALHDDPARGIVVVLSDLSGLRRNEQLLRSVLESVSDAIVTLDAHGTVLGCNPAMVTLFGYPEDELLGHSFKMLIPPRARDAHDGYLREYAQTGKGHGPDVGREVVAMRKNGSEFPCDLTVTSFALDGAQHFTAVMRDITARKRLEDQFRQAHKMEAFGQLAGGVAHDFNNLLTVILGAAEFVGSSLGEPTASLADQREAIADINDSSRRATELTQQLLAFSRKRMLEPRVTDPNATIRDTEKILRRLIGEDITLVTSLAPVPRVLVDPGQLSQVIMNLCLNARDAMPTGGRLEITTTPIARDGAMWTKISVTDTGTGMSDDVRAQVFEPFFTTKGAGHGTGLGLAVVQSVVTQYGGTVSVVSAPGAGSTFEIALPPAALQVVARPAAESVEPHGSETVLVVEDDPSVRRFAMRSLEAMGYPVIGAADGAAALQMLETHPAIDVAVVDVVMPSLDGQSLAERLTRRFPHVALLFVSGYTDAALATRGVDLSQAALLHKPYTRTSLGHAVRHALDTHRLR